MFSIDLPLFTRQVHNSDTILAMTSYSCFSPSQAGLTHSSSSTKIAVTAKWTAPPAGTGAIRFRWLHRLMLEITNYLLKGTVQVCSCAGDEYILGKHFK